MMSISAICRECAKTLSGSRIARKASCHTSWRARRSHMDFVLLRHRLIEEVDLGLRGLIALQPRTSKSVSLADLVQTATRCGIWSSDQVSIWREAVSIRNTLLGELSVVDPARLQAMLGELSVAMGQLPNATYGAVEFATERNKRYHLKVVDEGYGANSNPARLALESPECFKCADAGSSAAASIVAEADSRVAAPSNVIQFERISSRSSLRSLNTRGAKR
jgi:hypothetical protein